MDGVKTVAVIGLGYIGLPTATILATNGMKVIGVDVNSATVAAVNKGEVPFVEPDLETFMVGAVTQGNLTATTETPEADVYVIAVPTPFQEGYQPDLSYIYAAVDQIAPKLRGGELLILESTSPPGATEKMAERVLASRPDLDQSNDRQIVHFAHCPERVLPGRIMIELVTNDRIVGGITKEAALKAKELYESFCEGEILLTDARTAEMVKLVENSYRDVNIAFANELSLIAEKLDIDVWELIELANHHPRVNILQPGPGVGGHCIAVDPWFIVSATPDEARLIRKSREVNEAKPKWVIDNVTEKAERLKKPIIAALGLAFKPDIDDLRASPSVAIVEALADQLSDGHIYVVEPHIEDLPSSLSEKSNVTLSTKDHALDESDIILLLVDHTAFKSVGSEKLASKIVIDTKGIWR